MVLAATKLGYSQRAASVPFHATPLMGACVSEDEAYGLKLLLRNFGAPGSFYVFPWSSAPLSFRMDAFDAALHATIAETVAITPKAISDAIRSVNLSGAAGGEAACRERHRIEAAQKRLSCTEDYLSSRFKSRGSVAKLALLLSSTGLDRCHRGSNLRGPLRDMQLELLALYNFAMQPDHSAKTLSYCQKITTVTREVLSESKVLLYGIDMFTNKILVGQETPESAKLEELISELTWLLDGWDVVLQFSAENVFSLLDDVSTVSRLAALMPIHASRPSLQVVN